MSGPATLRSRMEGTDPVLAPLVVNGMMARLAEQAGFGAAYVGGGIGNLNSWFEANLNVTDFVGVGVEVAAACSLPMILDAACGFGDAMHLHRTIAVAEAAGYAAIEIEDQVFPKRAAHHRGEDQFVPTEVMVAKIREAVAARRDPDFLIIARTNDGREDIDDAVRRLVAYKQAGADVLLATPGPLTDPDDMARLGRELGPPLMYLAPPGGLSGVDVTLEDLASMGWRIVVDAMTLTMVVYEAIRDTCAELAGPGFSVRSRSADEWWQVLAEMNSALGLDALLAAEARHAQA